MNRGVRVLGSKDHFGKSVLTGLVVWETHSCFKRLLIS